tara:strand:+ start:199 stop:1743 length:1545 start_codon:yes stop_codon:yes gene_type:complete
MPPNAYEWQKTAVETFIEKKKGIVQATTGSGKTRMACDALLRVNPRIAHIIVPKVPLMSQWYDELRSVGYEGDIGMHGGGHPGEMHDINIWTINTARTRLNNPDYGKDAMLIIDEVHRSTGPANRAIYQMKPDWCLGISATAFQNGTYIVNLVGGGLIYNYTFEDALRDDVVCDYQIVNIGYEIDDETNDLLCLIADEIKTTRRIIKQNYGEPDSDDRWPMWVAELISMYPDAPEPIRLQHLWLDRKRILWSNNQRLVMTYELCNEHWNRRIVVFHQEIDQVEEIYQGLKDLGHDVVKEHSRMNRAERSAALDTFKKGEANILVSCRTLDEGFNVPDVDIGIIAASSSTATQYIQRAGRILRKSKSKLGAVLYRISAKNTVDEYATHNLLSSGAVDASRVKFITWKTGEEYVHTESVGRVSYMTLGLDTKGQFFMAGERKKDKHYIQQELAPLKRYLAGHDFKCGRFRISHDNNLYIWNNERFANIGPSPIPWQRLDIRVNRNWSSMYSGEEEE